MFIPALADPRPHRPDDLRRDLVGRRSAASRCATSRGAAARPRSSCSARCSARRSSPRRSSWATRSVRPSATTRARELGPIDEGVRVIGLNSAEPVLDALKAPPIPNVDGVLLGDPRRRLGRHARATIRCAEPFAGITEVDFDEARAFGGDVGITGMRDAGADAYRQRGRSYPNRSPRSSRSRSATRFTSTASATPLDLKVRQVVPARRHRRVRPLRTSSPPPARSGACSQHRRRPVPGGALGEAPASVVFVSNTGGVFAARTTPTRSPRNSTRASAPCRCRGADDQSRTCSTRPTTSPRSSRSSSAASARSA